MDTQWPREKLKKKKLNCTQLEVAVGDLGVVEVEGGELSSQVEGEVDENVGYLHPLLHPTGIRPPSLQPAECRNRKGSIHSCSCLNLRKVNLYAD